MTRNVISVILSLSVLGMTAAAAFAQTNPARKSSTSGVKGYVSPVEAATFNSRKLQITEDIEIMRRLLDATVKGLYATVPTSQALNISQSGSSASNLDSYWKSAFYSAFYGSPVSKSKRPQSSSNPFSRYSYTRNAVPGNTNRIRNLPIRESIGTYLNGHGIVYQLELPPLSEPPKPAKTVAKKSLAACPVMSLSKWDRTRKHLSGELKKINCSACHALNKDHPFLGHAELKLINCSACHLVNKNLQSADAYFKPDFSRSHASRLVGEFAVMEPSDSVLTRETLTERLIDLLAENGHHIRVLPSSQYLTLSVTFREQSPAPQADKQTSIGRDTIDSLLLPGATGLSSEQVRKFRDANESSSGKPSSRILPQNIKRTQKNNSTIVGVAGAEVVEAAGGGFGSAGGRFGSAGGGFGSTSAKLGNEELAGDLHMRQENFKKAAGEYEKALEKTSSPTFAIHLSKLIYSEVPPDNSRLLHKLAVAWLRGGEISKAKAVLDKLASFENTKRSSRPKQPETTSVSLPARLVISVTKANLDAVAAGKMSREEFRKQVAVDYFDPASVKPKKDEKKQSKR